MSVLSFIIEHILDVVLDGCTIYRLLLVLTQRGCPLSKLSSDCKHKKIRNKIAALNFLFIFLCFQPDDGYMNSRNM